MQKLTGFNLEARRRRMTLSMAPLIDVTFILLIFFMVVTQFSRFVPVDVSVRNAPVKTMRPLKQLPPQQGIVHLLVRADGLFELNGREIGGLDDLVPTVGRQLDLERGDGRDQPMLQVAPEGEVSVQLLIDTMNVLKTLPDCAVRLLIPGQKERTGE